MATVADGDAANAANFAEAPQALANRTAYLAANTVSVSALASSAGTGMVGGVGGGTLESRLTLLSELKGLVSAQTSVLPEMVALSASSEIETGCAITVTAQAGDVLDVFAEFSPNAVGTSASIPGAMRLVIDGSVVASHFMSPITYTAAPCTYTLRHLHAVSANGALLLTTRFNVGIVPLALHTSETNFMNCTQFGVFRA